MTNLLPKHQRLITARAIDTAAGAGCPSGVKSPDTTQTPDEVESGWLLDALDSWYLDDYSVSIAGLLPHATAFHGRYRALLEALQPLFSGGCPPNAIDAADELQRAGRRDEAQTLREFLEAVPERARTRALPLFLYQPPPLKSLPSVLRSFIEAGARSMGCDIAYLLLPTLATAAGAIGLSRRLRITRTWSEPAVLWLCTVAPSGSKKSPPLELGTEPLRKMEDELHASYAIRRAEYEDERLNYEVKLSDWKRKRASGEPPDKPPEPPEPRFVVSNTTVEALAPILRANPRGLLLVRDELGGWFASFDAYRGGHGGDAAAWEELYHGRRLTVDRKTGDQRSLRLPRAAVSVVGTIQPDTLRRLLTPELLEGGLAARILFAAPPPALGGKPPGELSPEAEQAYERILRRLTGLSLAEDERGVLEPVDLAMTPEGETHWWDWVDRWAQERRDFDGILAAVAAKLEGGVARLALVLHLAKWAEGTDAEPGPVTREAMAAAKELTRFFWREAQRVYGNIVIPEDNPASRLVPLVQWLERRGGNASSREVASSGPRRYRGNTELAEDDLNQLCKLACGRWVHLPAPEGPGRPPNPRFRLWTYAPGSETAETPLKTGFSFPLQEPRSAQAHVEDSPKAPEPPELGDEEVEWTG